MTQTFTQEHRAKVEEYLATHALSIGLGSKESACSIAAINLAISGTLTDDIPDCMSDVLGDSTISLQDAMPYAMRNSTRYKTLLPDMAGTRREHEQERLAIIMDWMWSVVLPQLQQIADSKGFGDAWKNMCQLKTADAAKAANNAYAVADSAATYAASSADAAARAVYDVGSTKQKVATVCAATLAARAAAAAAEALDDPDFWETVDPIGVLERMTYLNMETTE